jgi:hypothetical protein
MKQVDYKKELSPLYHASAKAVTVVEAPEMNFLMVDGAGDPNTVSRFHEAIEALFSMAYALKFIIKKGSAAIDYGVMPLEGLWWADDMAAFNPANKDAWKWTLMIMQPEFITAELFHQALEQVSGKKGLALLSELRLEFFCEGKAAQVMHIGPFSEEGPTIERLHHYIEGNGFQLRGKHHEIYLSDTRRAKPDKWRTIIRQPIR